MLFEAKVHEEIKTMIKERGLCAKADCKFNDVEAHYFRYAKILFKYAKGISDGIAIINRGLKFLQLVRVIFVI